MTEPTKPGAAEGQPESYMSIALRLEPELEKAKARIAELEAQLAFQRELIKSYEDATGTIGERAKRLSADLAAKESTIADLRAWIDRAAAEAGRQVGEEKDKRLAAEAEREKLKARLDRADYLIEQHRRFHQKVACSGGEDCYVCSAESEQTRYTVTLTVDEWQAVQARTKALESVINRIATQVGHPPIAPGELDVNPVAEAVERRLAYARDREETLDSITPESLQAFAASEAHHDEHHEREAAYRALLEKALPIIEEEAERRESFPAYDDEEGNYWTEMRALADEISAALAPPRRAREGKGE